MPKRPKQPLMRKSQSGLSETDLEFLLRGYNLLTGFSPSFKTDADAKRAYKQNKSFIFSLIGKYTNKHPENGLRWGSRPWAFYRFHFSRDLSELHLDFQGCWRDEDKRDTEFKFLKKADLLLKDEEKNFELQERKHKEFKANLRLTIKPKKIVEFPGKNK